MDNEVIIDEKDITQQDELGNNTNAAVMYYPENYIPNGNEKTMISSFDRNGSSSACYATPENGEFSFSIPL